MDICVQQKKTHSDMLAQMFGAMAQFLLNNENNSATWLSAPITGHALISPITRITNAEGYLLAHNGITFVGQLFGLGELTGRIEKDSDANIGALIGQGNDQIIFKCKMLRKTLARQRRPFDLLPVSNVLAQLAGLKWSIVYRRLHRNLVDDGMPGPPSYFTRRKDGIPVPTLSRFMAGYRNLLKMDICSKTLENSFLIMNRQTWTNLKQQLSTRMGEDGPDSSACGLCNGTENTMHLLFDCEKYSEPQPCGKNLAL